MTILNADWRRQFNEDVFQRLAHAHPDLTRIAGLLRDSVNVDVWTENPSDQDKLDPAKRSFSLEGWRTHYKREFARLNAWNTAHGTKLQNFDPQAKTALDGYLASMPTIGTTFATVTAKYVDIQGRLIQQTIAEVDRDTLATAIEAELQ